MCEITTALMVTSAAVGAAGSISSGAAANRAAKGQAAAMEQQAQDVLAKAEFDVEQAKRRFQRTNGSVIAKASGTGISIASFYDILADDASEAALEQKTIRYNAVTQANSIRRGAALTLQKGEDARISSYFGAAVSVASALAPMAKGGRGVSITSPTTSADYTGDGFGN